MKTMTCISSLLIGVLLASGSAQAEMYKWTDANGKTHYTQTPPPAEIESENIEQEIRLSAGKASGKSSQQTVQKDAGEDNLEEARKAGAKSEQKHKEFCAQQAAALKQMTANSLVKWKDNEGERFLSAEEKQTKIGDIEKNINSMCRPEMFKKPDRQTSNKELAQGKRFQKEGNGIGSGGKSSGSSASGAAGSAGKSGTAATGGLLPSAD